MSSLSQQLKVINEKAASLAVDRKSRQKIHLRSLIFAPKVAAGQDYDYLFTVGREGFEELCEVDLRFVKFGKTLFAEFSIQMDRNVEDADTVAHLDASIDAFFELVGPYYQLNPAIKAAEWLVRRFYANLHNAELMLLLVLPHYQTPVFLKVINVVPMAHVPTLFTFIKQFKEPELRNPLLHNMTRVFYTDFELWKLFVFAVEAQVERGTVYQEQLGFFVSMTVQMLASLSKQPEEVSSRYLPVVLRVAAKMLALKLTEVILSAYLVIAVVATIVPLTEQVITSITASIVNQSATTAVLQQTYIVLGQVWHYYGGEFTEPQPVLAKLPLDTELLAQLVNQEYNMLRLLLFVYLATGDLKVLKLINLKVSDKFFAACVARVIEHEDVPAAEYLAAFNHSQFVASLAASNITLAELEMKLLTTLAPPSLADEIIEVEPVEEEEIEAWDAVNPTKTKLFFTADVASEVAHLAKVVVKASLTHLVGEVINKICKDQEVAMLLMVAIAYTPAVPVGVRVASLEALGDAVSAASSKSRAPYLLIPVLLAGCIDPVDAVRQHVVAVLRTVCTLTTQVSAKNPELIMESQIYGGVSAEDMAIIPPAEATTLLTKLLEVADDLALDAYRVVPVLFDSVFVLVANSAKKERVGVLYKTYVLNQWSLCQPVVLKSKVWQIMGRVNNQLPEGIEDRGFFFDTNVLTYVTKRSNYIAEADLAKIPFLATVEPELVAMVGGAQPQLLLSQEVDWLLSAVAHGLPNLAIAANARIIKLYNEAAYLKPYHEKIVAAYVDMAVEADDVDVDAGATLQQLRLDPETLEAALDNVQLLGPMPEDQGAAKRRRRSSLFAKNIMAQSDINTTANLHLRKLAVVLETLVAGLSSHRIPASLALLPPLFLILTDLDILGNDGNLPIHYPQELLVQAMLLVLKNASTPPPAGVVRVDLIVNCLRNSHSPQLQNRLLLVIAHLATLAPETVLHLIMPVFTFMGAHTVRQDDEFSTTTLLHTIATVVPALVALSSDLMALEIEFLLTSFVATFQHIPPHRRVLLFVNLTKTVGVDTGLPLVLFLLAQHHLKGVAATYLDFCNNYLQLFSAHDQLVGLKGYVELWQQVPEEPLDVKLDEYKRLLARSAFGTSIALLDEPGLARLKKGLLQFITSVDMLLLKMKLAVVMSENTEEKQADLDLVNALTGFCLETVTTYSEPALVYQLLTAILELLPLAQFVDSVLASLLAPTSKVSTILATNYAQLLGQRFENDVVSDDAEAVEMAERLLPVLAKGFSGDGSPELQLAYIQTFATITAKVEVTNHKLLVDALASLTPKLAIGVPPEVTIAATAAIGAIVTVLGVKTMGFFAKIVPPAIKLCEEIADDENPDTVRLVQSAIIVLLSSMIKRIPTFMLLLLEPILTVILKAESIEISIRRAVLQIILDHIDAGEVLKALCNIWPALAPTQSPANLGLLLSTIEDAIQRLDKKTASKVAVTTFKWVVQAFEFRATSLFDTNTLYRLENSVFSSVKLLVMKLNDKTFRPLFVKLVRWMVDGESLETPEADKDYRMNMFFRFYSKLQEELRGIITLYFSYLIDPVVAALNLFSGPHDIGLRRIILNSLTLAFKYDNDDYWSQQGRFELICEPLLLQIATIEPEITKYLVKAVTSFIANVSSDEYNEKLVKGLIVYIGPDALSESKICTVRILKSVFQKMGDQWLSFLPTMIPHIAELLEDDDEHVELEVRQGLVKVIENVLGEPLDRYLE